jgi:hypothetical protein
VLPCDGTPIIGAELVHHLLHGWRERVWNLKGLKLPEKEVQKQ